MANPKKALKSKKKKPSTRGKKSEATVLITGGAGFIGSNTLVHLFNRYPTYRFIVLDALTYAGDIRNIPEEIHHSSRFRFWYGDVRNAKVVDHLVAQVDMVVHFAAETHVSRSIFDDASFFDTDVIGTQRVANAVLKHKKNIKRFIHISTSEVYGTAASKKMDEDHPLNPMSPYAAAKAGADRLVYSYIQTYNIPATIIRPFNAYGPRQHLEKLTPRFVTSIITGEPLTIHGSGQSSRDFVHVLDIARAIDMVLHAPEAKVQGEVFNVATGTHKTVSEIAQKIEKIMSGMGESKGTVYTTSMMNIGDRPGQVFRHTGSASKIKELVGWEPSMDFDEGLRETAQWYVENEDWWKGKLWMRHVPIETEDGKIEFH